MPTINQLPRLDSLASGDQLPVYATAQGDSRRMSVELLQDYMQDNLNLPDNSDEVNLLQAGTGAVTRTVQAKLRETVSLRDFGADPAASAAVNNAAINAAFASGAKRVIAEPNAVYAVSGQIAIPSTLEFDGQGCTFSVTMPASIVFFQVFASASIKNLTINFNNGYCYIGINFPNSNLGYIELTNVAVKNVNDIATTYGTIPININANGNEIRLDGITIENITKRTNNDPLDLLGGIEGIYAFLPSSTSVALGGYMRNIEIRNLLTVNSVGTQVYEVANAIYVACLPASDNRARLVIENVRGYDFGKRLIKTQCSDLIIQNVYAEAINVIAQEALSLQDQEPAPPAVVARSYNVKVKDVVIRGKMRYGIVSSVNDALIDGADIDISLTGTNSFYGNNALGIGLSGDSTTITNSFVSAKICLFISREYGTYAGDLKNLLISNSTFKTNESGSLFLEFSAATTIASLESGLFSNIVFDASDFPGGNTVLGNSTNQSGFVSFNNCVLIDNDATTNGGSYFTFDKFKTINVTGFTHLNKNATSLINRTFRVFRCGSLTLASLNLQAKPNSASITTDTVDSLIVSGMYVDPATTNAIVMTTTTASRLSGVNRSKVSFNDVASRQGCLFAPEFSSGTTAQRPSSGLIAGQQYWDTTLVKPIWWNGTEWKDAANTTV